MNAQFIQKRRNELLSVIEEIGAAAMHLREASSFDEDTSASFIGDSIGDARDALITAQSELEVVISELSKITGKGGA